MSATIMGIAQLLGVAAGLDAGELLEVAGCDALGNVGTPYRVDVFDALLGRTGEDDRQLADLVAHLGTALNETRLLRNCRGDRVKALAELAHNSKHSPLKQLRHLCNLSHLDLSCVMGVTEAQARELCGPGWRAVRGVDHVDALASLGRHVVACFEGAGQWRAVA